VAKVQLIDNLMVADWTQALERAERLWEARNLPNSQIDKRLLAKPSGLAGAFMSSGGDPMARGRTVEVRDPFVATRAINHLSLLCNQAAKTSSAGRGRGRRQVLPAWLEQQSGGKITHRPGERVSTRGPGPRGGGGGW
jgi:hypothetical protein